MSQDPQPPKTTSVPPRSDRALCAAGPTDFIHAAPIPAEAEPLLADVIEYLPDATFVLDAEKRVVAWNRACEELTGVSKERLIGRGDYAYAEPFYGERRPILVDLLDLPAPELEAKYAYVQRRGNVVYAETFVQRLRGGAGAYLSGEASALFDREGRRCGYVESIRDITERKHAEAELRRQEEALRLRNVVLSTQQEASPDGILVVNDKGQIISFNRRFDEMWRIPPEILATASAKRVLDWATTQVRNPESFASIVRDVHGRPQPSTEDEFSMADGRIFERYSAPMSADGTYLGRVWYFKDITERKRAEVERDKAEQQLWRAQKMEAIGSLAGGVAHDFNNLLSVIMAFTEFALEQIHAGDPLANDLSEVQKASERAAALTRQLLAFGRKQVMRPVALNLNEVALGLEGMLRRILGEDIDLVLTLTNELGSVRVDPSQLEQVLMNLVVNARDAMTAGGTLTVATSNIELSEATRSDAGVMPPGHYVQLTVSDTGSGMSEETVARIFEPFFTTKQKGKGTGLGLSTVFGIIKQSGGDILVSSELGRGSTFKIRLPRETAPTVKVSFQRPPVRHSSRGTETVLIVEDEQALRAVAQRALTEAGYTALVASNGDEAVGLCTRYRGDIHLLLTDVIMPGMSGPSLARELGKSRSTLKILYMSGYADDAFGKHAQLEAGAHFLPKPFTAADITRKVRAVLDSGS